MIPRLVIARRYCSVVPTTKQEKEKLRAVVIRMPADLHEAIKARAAADERSVAQAMRYALRNYAQPS